MSAGLLASALSELKNESSAVPISVDPAVAELPSILKTFCDLRQHVRPCARLKPAAASAAAPAAPARGRAPKCVVTAGRCCVLDVRPIASPYRPAKSSRPAAYTRRILIRDIVRRRVQRRLVRRQRTARQVEQAAQRAHGFPAPRLAHSQSHRPLAARQVLACRLHDAREDAMPRRPVPAMPHLRAAQQQRLQIQRTRAPAPQARPHQEPPARRSPVQAGAPVPLRPPARTQPLLQHTLHHLVRHRARRHVVAFRWRSPAAAPPPWSCRTSDMSVALAANPPPALRLAESTPLPKSPPLAAVLAPAAAFAARLRRPVHAGRVASPATRPASSAAS